MTTTPPAVLSNVEEALVAALGDAVSDGARAARRVRRRHLLAGAARARPPARRSPAPTSSCDRGPRRTSPRSCAIADAHGVPVVPWGGGSGTQGGCLPIHGGIVIDLRGLDEIVAIDDVSMTVTAQAGVNGKRLEAELNARGLMLPHYPASVEWATVGGYIAARGSGVLSTRYGKIEDLLLSLRVATPAGGLMETVGVPRHAVGPELTQLFVGSEGTLGVITRATLQLVPLPQERRFAAVSFPSVEAGTARDPPRAPARPPPLGRAHVRRGRHPEGVRARRRRGPQRHLHRVRVRGRAGGRRSSRSGARSRIAQRGRREVLDPALGQRWWDRRYDFYHPPHNPELPSIWGTLDVVATYDRIGAVYDALHRAVREPYADTGLELRMHFSHWYLWGTMIYGRFVVPDGGPDALALHDRIWEDGMTAALDAGGVMNDHHGVGIKLGPYMRRQHGAALDAMRRIKTALDPNGVMNPGKMGL